MIGQESVRIAKVDQADLQGVIDLISACRLDLIKAGIHQWDDQYPNPECVIRDLAEGNLYGAEIDDRLVGTIALNQEQEPEYSLLPWLFPTPSLVIHRLCVSPSHQGLGIGSALMRFSERHAIDMRCNSIRLDVYSGNPNAVNLYKHLGYRIAGQFTFPSRSLPFLCMEKVIDLSADSA
jgi:ribosomal protein S18 acetylase RimI-like enzyme